MVKGLYVRPSGRPPEVKKIVYYMAGYIETPTADAALCYLVEKTDGTSAFFVRYGKSLNDPAQNEKISGTFMTVDEEIYKLYKSYLEAGHYAGYTEANKLIRMRGFA